MVSETLLNEIVNRVVEVARPTRVILFGSRARGDAGADSDIDLLVVVEKTESRRELAVRLLEAMRDLKVNVDVVVATERIMERYGNIPGAIYEVAGSEGTVLYAA
jgi:predicted nucleotidyltransferase